MLHALKKLWVEKGRVKRILLPADYRYWLKSLLRKLPQVLRRRSLGPVDEAFGETFTVKLGDRHLYLYRASFGVVREIFGQECYCYAADLQDARQILDLGANAGVFGLFALASAPHAMVRMVEAQPEFMAVLSENLVRNGFAGRTKCENALVGGSHDSWSRQLRQRHPSLSDFSIIDYIADVGECDFMKCDVEGAEYVLFAGDLSWTAKVRRIALEYHGTWEQGHILGERLRAIGFVVVQRPHGTLGYLHASRL